MFAFVLISFASVNYLIDASNFNDNEVNEQTILIRRLYGVDDYNADILEDALYYYDNLYDNDYIEDGYYYDEEETSSKDDPPPCTGTVKQKAKCFEEREQSKSKSKSTVSKLTSKAKALAGAAAEAAAKIAADFKEIKDALAEAQKKGFKKSEALIIKMAAKEGVTLTAETVVKLVMYFVTDTTFIKNGVKLSICIGHSVASTIATSGAGAVAFANCVEPGIEFLLKAGSKLLYSAAELFTNPQSKCKMFLKVGGSALCSIDSKPLADRVKGKMGAPGPGPSGKDPVVDVKLATFDQKIATEQAEISRIKLQMTQLKQNLMDELMAKMKERAKAPVPVRRRSLVGALSLIKGLNEKTKTIIKDFISIASELQWELIYNVLNEINKKEEEMLQKASNPLSEDDKKQLEATTIDGLIEGATEGFKATMPKFFEQMELLMGKATNGKSTQVTGSAVGKIFSTLAQECIGTSIDTTATFFKTAIKASIGKLSKECEIQSAKIDEFDEYEYDEYYDWYYYNSPKRIGRQRQIDYRY